ncbi:hypothetical protein NLX83_13120 [Allokutzneria sp. A3M-2-11 16]|uniref:phage tail tape measure protein n=1 Tax=Allokutzneria sp. A3M-2-11 16 TaxID=2962043 RepID=UPI0020B656BF|nr:phage tail tape measure protein [Allokutzneria sp. A3M-2-11 16]MCP3800200.1 hypothetical protein [Allokutzneria sp. A3M-2-11 16]
MASSAAQFAAVGVAAGGIGGLLTESLDRAQISAKLGAQLGATADEARRYGEAAGRLYADGYGESFAQVSSAIAAVTSTLGKLGSQAELEAVSRKALDLASVFDVDVNRAVASSGVLLKYGLARDATEAFDLLTRGLQGVPAAVRDDLLEAVDEYSVFFHEIGFSGAEAFGVLKQAASGGKIQLDKAADAVKEFHIRSTDMTKGPVEAYQALGLNAEDMARKVHAGGTTARDAFQTVVNGVLAMKDPVAQSNTAVALFGTQFEDLGNLDALAALRPAVNGLTEVAGAADRLGTSLHDNASARLTQFGRALQDGFVTVVGGYVLPVAERVAAWLSTTFGPALSVVGSILTTVVISALSAFAGWISENSSWLSIVAGVILTVFLPSLVSMGIASLTARAQVVGTFLAMRLEAIKAALAQSYALAQTVTGWVSLGVAAVLHGARVAGAWLMVQGQALTSGASMAASMAATVASTVAGWVTIAAQSLLHAARMATAWVIALGPVGWVTAAVVGLVALIVSNWETVSQWTSDIWNSVVSFLSGAWDGIVDSVRTGVRTALGLLGDLLSWLAGLPGRLLGALGDAGRWLLNVGRDILRGLWDGLVDMGTWLKNKIVGFFSSLVPDWVKSALGIRSPSRVMADIGRWLPPGLAVGIERTAGVAVGAARSLAADVVGAVRGTDTLTPALAFASQPPRVPPYLPVRAGRFPEVRNPLQDNGFPVKQDVTVNVTTPADPHEIGREVAWALRNHGR